MTHSVVRSITYGMLYLHNDIFLTRDRPKFSQIYSPKMKSGGMPLVSHSRDKSVRYCNAHIPEFGVLHSSLGIIFPVLCYYLTIETVSNGASLQNGSKVLRSSSSTRHKIGYFEDALASKSLLA